MVFHFRANKNQIKVKPLDRKVIKKENSIFLCKVKRVGREKMIKTKQASHPWTIVMEANSIKAEKQVFKKNKKEFNKVKRSSTFQVPKRDKLKNNPCVENVEGWQLFT